MSDLADFLLARIAEEAGVARQIQDHDRHDRWRNSSHHHKVRDAMVRSGRKDPGYTVTGPNGDLPMQVESNAIATHIATWDPDRILADCDARRRVVKIESTLEILRNSDKEETMLRASRRLNDHDTVLRLLALPYATHPGYRDEWQPRQ